MKISTSKKHYDKNILIYFLESVNTLNISKQMLFGPIL